MSENQQPLDEEQAVSDVQEQERAYLQRHFSENSAM